MTPYPWWVVTWTCACTKLTCLHARKVSFTSILISLHTYLIHPIIRSLNKLIPTTHCDTTVVQQHVALVHHHEPVHDLDEGPDQLPNTLFHPQLLASWPLIEIILNSRKACQNNSRLYSWSSSIRLLWLGIIIIKCLNNIICCTGFF